mgnify:CR=1 FL=1
MVLLVEFGVVVVGEVTTEYLSPVEVKVSRPVED